MEQEILSDGEMVHLRVGLCLNKVNQTCSLLKKVVTEELLKLPMGIANTNFCSF